MTKAEELAETTGSEPIKPEPKVINTPVSGSSFIHVQQEGKHFLTLQRYKVTEDFDSEEKLKEFMEASWMELMTRTMIVMYRICQEMDSQINGE